MLAKCCADPEAGKGDTVCDLLNQRTGTAKSRRGNPDTAVAIYYE